MSIHQIKSSRYNKTVFSLLKYMVVMPAILVTAQASFALSDTEIQATLKSYEDRIHAMEKELQNNHAQASTAAESSDSLSSSNLKINGFMTAQVQASDRDLSYQGINESMNFRGNSKAGIQFNYKLNDKADATIQMVARSGDGGDNSWRVDAEWAYIGYQLTDDLKVRAGRLRLPFYMYSDTLDVGYTYPWVKPPTDIYRSPISEFDGVDMLYNFRTAAVNNRLQVWGGSYQDNTGSDRLQFKDMVGASITSSWSNFTVRLMDFNIKVSGIHNESGFNTTPGPCPALPVPGVSSCTYLTGLGNVVLKSEDALNYGALGFGWDNGNYFVTTETTTLSDSNGVQFIDQKAGYISAGARINQWTPYATYGWYYTANENDFAASLQGANAALSGTTLSQQSKSVSLGLRRELGNGLAAKVQVDHYYDFGGVTNGYFSPSSQLETADVMTLSLDAVF